MSSNSIHRLDKRLDRRDRDREYEREKLNSRKSDLDRGYGRRDERNSGGGGGRSSSDHCSSLPSAYSDDKINRTSGTKRSSHDRYRNRVPSSKRPSSGDWAEYMSSSGKKYYYNSVTGVSQWEKPKEYIDEDNDMSNDRDISDDDDRRSPLREDKLSTPESLRTLGSCESIESKKRLHDSTPENRISDGSMEDVPSACSRYDTSSSFHRDQRRSSVRSSAHYQRESDDKYRDHRRSSTMRSSSHYQRNNEDKYRDHRRSSTRSSGQYGRNSDEKYRDLNVS